MACSSRSRSRVFGWVLLTLLLAATPARADLGHHRDSQRCRITSVSDAPDPFTPPAASKLSVVVGVRKVTGLGGWDESDDDDCDEDRGGRRNHRKTFQVTVTWTIRSNGSAIAQVEKTVEVLPPLNIARLPTRGSRVPKKFALVPLALEWGGLRSSGHVAAPGTYDYVAVATFTRTHVHRMLTKVKFIDESDPVTGSVTISSGGTAPPTVTILQPRSGLLTRSSSLVVSGQISGQAPLSVKINGVSAAVGATTYAGSASLVEGQQAITAVVTDGPGRTAQAAVSVTKDGVPPSIQVSVPASGSTTIDTMPDFVVTFSDPTPGSGVDTSTLAWKLDGESLVASSSMDSTRAVITPNSPIGEGQHEFTASIRDRAGGEGSASTTFTILAGKPAPPSVDSFPATTNVPVMSLSGGKPANTSLLMNGVERVAMSASTTWSATKTLLEGSNALRLQTRSVSGLDSDPVTVNVTLDSVPPPPPTVNLPPTGVTNPALTITGTKLPGDAVVINGVVVVPADSSTTWSVPVTLNPGANTFVIETQDAAGNRSITQGGQVAGVVRSKPVIGNLTISPPIVPTGQPVTIAYRLFAEVPPAENADLRVTISIEDGDQPIRTVFAGVQQGGPAGLPYSIPWDGRNDQGQFVAVNTSYKVVMSADRANPSTQPAILVNANSKESSITITGSQEVASPDGKLKVIFRPDDARMKIEPVTLLTAVQSTVLARRQIRPLGKPYRITVDRPFASRVVGILKHPRPVGRLLRAYQWAESEQDWMPIARTTWNPVEQTLSFAIPGQGMIVIGSTPDAEPPRVTAVTTPVRFTAIRVEDRGSGINPAKTRVRSRGVDITQSTTTQNLNGTREQLVTTRHPSARSGEVLIYLEDWSGNGKLHRVGRTK